MRLVPLRQLTSHASPAFRELYNKYHDQGFEIIAFPANQFGGQAPGTDEEERAWALKKFGIDFDVFDHVAVLDKPTPMWEGPTEISPLYRYMKSVLPGEIPCVRDALLAILPAAPHASCAAGITPSSSSAAMAFRCGGTALRIHWTRAWRPTWSLRWLASRSASAVRSGEDELRMHECIEDARRAGT